MNQGERALKTSPETDCIEFGNWGRNEDGSISRLADVMNPFWECHPLLLTEEKLLNIMLEALVDGKPLIVRPQHVPSDVELDVEDRKRQLDEYIEDEGEQEVIMGRMFREFGMQWWDNEKVFEEMKKTKEAHKIA